MEEEYFDKHEPEYSPDGHVKNISKVSAYEISTIDENDFNENDQYEVTFYFSQATKALIIHFLHMILGPISLPVLYKAFGRPICYNMQFGFKKHYTQELIIWAWLMLTLFNLWYFRDITDELLCLYITSGSIITMRNVLISAKYGYFPLNSWNKLCVTKFTDDELGKFVLISSWLRLNSALAQEEIKNSYKRLSLIQTNMKFKFTTPFCRACGAVLSNFFAEMNLSADKNHIPVLEFSQFIIDALRKHSTRKYFISIEIMGILYSSSPIMLRVYRYGTSWIIMSGLEMFYIIYSVITSYFFSRAFLMFIQSGVEDFKRKKLLMAQCTGLISRVDRKYLLIGVDCYPKFNMNDPNTIMSWYYMRRCFLDFGKRYTLRIFLYASLILPMAVCVVIVIVLQMFNVIGISYNYYFVPFMILVAQLIYMIVLMALAAVDLNDYFNIHIDVLLDQIGKILRKKILKPEKYEDPEKLIDTIDFVTSKLSEDKVLRPIKIMGITMDAVFILKILSIAASGIFAVIQIFYKL